MKYQTATLEGALLDAAVALAEGWSAHLEPVEHWLAREGSYSTDQAAGGKLIDLYRISTVFMSGQWEAFNPVLKHDHYLDVVAGDGDGNGPTRLIAAMRAHILRKIGREVDL